MREILLTSSALILALLALRRAFRKRISRRVQYALWALVLARLLIPANLPAANFSVLSVSRPVRAELAERMEESPVYVLPLGEKPVSDAPPAPASPWREILPAGGHPVVSEDEGTVITYAFTLEEALGLVWRIGAGCMALWLAGSNLRFWRMLRRRRLPLEPEGCRRPVYLVEEGLASPCLFGLFRPAVYLTPASMEDREGLRHVLAHEEAHARQGDPLWALLRGVCLALYWFDPLVWLAARAAREDCELACDELALRGLGEEERVAYGRTLLRLIPVKGPPGDALLAATTMASDKRRLKERITRIAENRRMKRAALLTVLTAAAAVCAVTFTGCVTGEAPAAPETPEETPEPTAPSSAPAASADREGALPEWEAALSIPLSDLTPYAPVPVEALPAADLFAGHHGEGHHQEYPDRHRSGGGCRTTEHCGTFAWSYGGEVYVSSHDLRLSSYPDDYFLCFPEQEYREEAFTGLFGYDGVRISYSADQGGGYFCTFNDYYVFRETADGGTGVFLLARVYGVPQMIDLDGNGTKELVGDGGRQQAQIFFQRDGGLCEADVGSLLREHWHEMSYMEADGWEGRYLKLWGFVPAKGSDGSDIEVTAWRQLRFDGESLLLCRRAAGHADHAAAGVQAPDDVLRAAKEAARGELDARQDSGEAYRPEWDDYRIAGLTRVYPEDPPPEGLELAVYSLHFELHTATPERVVLAGGIYVDEDGWVGGFGADSPGFLLFLRSEDGSYALLDSAGYDFSPGTPAFARWVNRALEARGLPQIPIPET